MNWKRALTDPARFGAKEFENMVAKAD